ncbi:MAG: thioredoxin domain-containing protein [Bacteroidales bacterium]|nr:thioredoxin domain-containing protein [Bacteroidales bacterium]
MKQFLTLFLLGGILVSCTQPRQEKVNVVIIEFEGKRYDSLYLVLVSFDRPDFRRDSIKGHSSDGYLWKFHYPDSLYDRIVTFYFNVPGSPDTVSHSFIFNLVLQDNTLQTANFIFGRPSSHVIARYMRTTTLPNRHTRCRETGSPILKTYIIDNFEIFTNDEEVILSLKVAHYGYGNISRSLSMGLTYEEIIQRDMEFIRQHPNSQGMIIALRNSLRHFRSKDDIAKLFNLFSEELQQSFYGQIIYKHITRTVFVNKKLATTWDTYVFEPILQDSSKYNLILFSASWCAPCIRLIPILKEIYQDLGQKLIMTYVSLDHERTAENWREKMYTHEIPWRSLIVLTREKGMAINDEYGIFAVPHNILVHPNSMKMEVLNLWEERDRQRLYELVR